MFLVGQRMGIHRVRCCLSFRSASSNRSSSSTISLQQLFTSNDVNREGSPYASGQKDEQEREPHTVWNRWPPSEADFWHGPRKEQSTAYTKDESPAVERLRTGFLHNIGLPAAESGAASETRSATEDSPENSSTENMASHRIELAKLQQERNHRIISPPTMHAGGGDQLLAVTEHLISVPLYRDGRTSDKRIDVFFTVVEKVPDEDTRIFLQRDLSSTSQDPRQRAEQYVKRAALQNADSMVLYLHDGPGFAAPRPVVDLGIAKGCGSWADAALHKHGYNRIILMDYRGTGKSTPINKQTLKQQFLDHFLLDQENDIELNCRGIYGFKEKQPDEVVKVENSVDELVDYIVQFRADNIVQDAECIREALMLQTLYEDTDDDSLSKRPRPWGCSLGQFYGGFCHVTYLSNVEYPPKVMLFAGGIPPLERDLKEMYGAMWERIKLRNKLYYEMYPGDIAAVKTIVRKLIEQPVKLPSGGRLSARRFLSLGIELGGSLSAFASLHELISSAFIGGLHHDAKASNVADLEFTKAFLMQVDSRQSFDDNPLRFWLHEAKYDFIDNEKGLEGRSTDWASQRALWRDPYLSFNFEYHRTCELDDDRQPTYFFGEHVAEWMPEDYAGLSGVGLNLVATALAEHEDWDSLYEPSHMREVIREKRTRAAAAVYNDDLFIDESIKLTEMLWYYLDIGVLVTMEYRNSGLRDEGSTLFSKLHGMAKGGIRIPS